MWELCSGPSADSLCGNIEPPPGHLWLNFLTSKTGATSAFLPENMVQGAHGLPSSGSICGTTVWLTQLTRELRLTLTLLPGSLQYVTKAGQCHTPGDPLDECWESLRRQFPARQLTQLDYEHLSNAHPFAPGSTWP